MVDAIIRRPHRLRISLAHATAISMNGRTQLADLPPRGSLFYAGLFLGGVLIVAVLEACYAIMPLLNPHTTDGRVATFDLDSEGSLAVFFSSFTLLAAAGVCALIYVLRSGTKLARGLWLWATCCWTMMSIDECSSLHEAFKEVMSHATGTRIWHDGTLWWVLAYFLVLSTTGLRLLWEMRRCWSACAMFLLVAVFYSIAVLAELSWLTAKDSTGVMVEEGCEMLGNFALLTATALFARHTALTNNADAPVVLAVRFADEHRASEHRAKLPSDEPLGV